MAGREAKKISRISINDPEKLKPGTIFRIFQQAQASAADTSLPDALAEIGQHAAEPEQLERAREAARRIAEDVSADDLAWLLASSLEGTLSTTLGLATFNELRSKKHSIGNQLRDVTATVRMTPHQTREMNILVAAVMHRLLLQGAAEGLRDHAEPIDLSGRYTLVASENCGIASGSYRLVQRGHVVEIGSKSAIVLYGAVGATRVHLVANDRRFAVVARSADRSIFLSAPDRIADVLNGVLRPGWRKISATGPVEPHCIVTLLPEEIVS